MSQLVSNVQILCAGSCNNMEYMTLSSGRFKHVDIPNMFALIRHPVHGFVLFDTGYHQRFEEATKQFPFSLYAHATPVTIPRGGSAVEQLAELGVPAAQIAYIVISHFHADHVCGLKDFPKAIFVYFGSAYGAVKPYAKSPLCSVIRAFLPDLLPADFEERSLALKPIEEEVGKEDKVVQLQNDKMEQIHNDKVVQIHNDKSGLPQEDKSGLLQGGKMVQLQNDKMEQIHGEKVKQLQGEKVEQKDNMVQLQTDNMVQLQNDNMEQPQGEKSEQNDNMVQVQEVKGGKESLGREVPVVGPEKCDPSLFWYQRKHILLRQLLPKQFAPFSMGYDLFGDGSIILVQLPGHTEGHLGAFVKTEQQQLFFFIGDACWNSQSFRGVPDSSHGDNEKQKNTACCCRTSWFSWLFTRNDGIVMPSRLTSLIHHNWGAYRGTIEALYRYHRKYPETIIVPAHCPHIFQAHVPTRVSNQAKL